MTRTIELTPEQERALARKAARLGLDVDAYLRRLVDRAAESGSPERGFGSPPLRRVKREGGYSPEWTEEDLRDVTRDSLGYAARSLEEDTDG